MEITLEKIELVKDRTGVSYKEAKEALEAAEGSVFLHKPFPRSPDDFPRFCLRPLRPHRNDRRGDGSGNGQPDAQPQVGVGRAEDHR